MATDQLSRTFAALADPTRRSMLALLADRERTVGELVEPFDMTFAAVSKHLRVLEAAGLVHRGRSAQYRPATLNPEPLAAVSKWVAEYEKFWTANLDSMGELLARLQSEDSHKSEDHDKGEDA
ncbi:ArsR/SmtB family transcription factor [Mycolicibacterium llatzerense]|uniref:ArsR/SmtB family transcription factor n=1 Tax=Mycolicibacterium llatzerense TaxID=280871 RepID=UPI0021B6D7B5|nr:metalloregulator ArsR/SmtB family transcription factor [Mycolicibacterium llatzerense]MCT7366102.1 transcriptional regulator [Mycolicibacterium llatzerense]